MGFSISCYGNQWIEFPWQRQLGRQLGKIETWRRNQKWGNYTKEGAKKRPSQASRCCPCGHPKAAVQDRPFPSTVMTASCGQLQGSSRHPLQPHLPPFLSQTCSICHLAHLYQEASSAQERSLQAWNPTSLILYHTYWTAFTCQARYWDLRLQNTEEGVQALRSSLWVLRNSQSVAKHVCIKNYTIKIVCQVVD